MNIAIDARSINWYKGTGIGTYTENVLKNILKLDKENYYHIFWAGEHYEEYVQENSKIIFASNKNHSFFEQYYFPGYILRENIDIYHVPQNGIGLLRNINCKKVVTIHDLIPYVMPETVGKGYLQKFLRELPQIIEASEAILTVSEYSKKDILKFFPMNPDKIFVTPLSADIKYKPLDKEKCRAQLAAQYNINNPFILYIGGFSPRKNVISLIKAFHKIYKHLPEEYSLVIVGSNTEQGKQMNDLITSLDLNDKIKFTGFVQEDQLPLFYNGCQVFVYPSLYEGFGLPPLEAMSCGAPVITSLITSIPEVVGDAGILINPYDQKELEDALEFLLNEEEKRNELSSKGLERASLFNWKTTAENTLKVYNALNNKEV